jgi:alpha-beta hydrolase superfamily lysophospholipase
MDGESTLTTFVASDGDNIAVQDWPMQNRKTLRGVVLLLHGLGEHAGRYDHVAQRLNGWGFAVRGFDQYGHGESGGKRGALPTQTRLLDDLVDIVDSTRARMRGDTPLILLGHSMGGLVAARFVSLGLRPVQGLVLSSPAFDLGLNPLQKIMMAVLPRVAPKLRVGNGVNAELISHDRNVVAAYLADKHVHDRISARLARFMAEAIKGTLAQAPVWKVPTLLMYAGADKLINPAGSRAFIAAAPKDKVQSRCFEPLYHEIFNEVDSGPVFEELNTWLNVRF